MGRKVKKWDEEEEIERGDREGREGIEFEEVKKVMRRLKRGKAAGNDGVPNEVWIWGGEGLTRTVGEVCKRIWRGEGFPDSWKESIIMPIVNKSGAKRVEEYREMTLLPTISL